MPLYYNNKIMRISNNSNWYRSQNTLLNGLVSYWDFQENSNDKWISNLNWTDINTSLDNNGLYGKCYSFNSSYIRQTLNLSQNSFTINLWYKPTTISTTQRIWLTSVDINTDVTDEVSVDLVYITGNNNFRFRVVNGSSDYQLFSANNALVLNTWNMLTFSWNKSTGEIKLWVNNVVYSRFSSTTINNYSYTRVGIYSPAAPQYISGNIDEMSYWNRVLTNDEVKRLYNSRKGLALADLSYIPKFLRESNSYTPKKVGYNLLKDLISYWSLSDTTDVHRNNDLINTNATSGQTGKIDTCYYFDGTAYMNNINNSQNFGQGDKTISCWIKTNSTTDGYIFGGWSKYIGAGGPQVQMTINVGTDTKINLYTQAGGIRVHSTTTVTDDNWHHVVWKFSGTTGYIFVDGNEEVSVNVGTITWNEWNFQLGGSGFNDGGTSKYVGYLDEVGVWNRALTNDEIKVLYNKGSGLPYENFRY